MQIPGVKGHDILSHKNKINYQCYPLVRALNDMNKRKATLLSVERATKERKFVGPPILPADVWKIIFGYITKVSDHRCKSLLICKSLYDIVLGVYLQEVEGNFDIEVFQRRRKESASFGWRNVRHKGLYQRTRVFLVFCGQELENCKREIQSFGIREVAKARSRLSKMRDLW